MDLLLSKAGSTIVTFAVKSGVQFASNYVIKSVGKLVENAPESDRRRVERLRKKLQSRIEIVSHAVELLRFKAASGVAGLDSALTLVHELMIEINEFQDTIDDLSPETGKASFAAFDKEAIQKMELSMKSLVLQIDQAIPLINLALTTSADANFNPTLSTSTLAMGQIMRATTMVNDANKLFAASGAKQAVQVGPAFDVVFYNVFYNPARTAQEDSKPGSEILWREKFARATFRILRVPDKTFDYAHDLCIEESFDDDRYHDEETDKKQKVQLDIRTLARVFFSAAGRLLKLEDSGSPVLVLKVKKQTRQEIDNEINMGESADAEVEWLAVGEYSKDGKDSDIEGEESSFEDAEESASGKELAFSRAATGNDGPALLEYLLRLCVLQANDQVSILEVNDDRLRLYLNDENPKTRSNAAAVPALSTQMQMLTLEATDKEEANVSPWEKGKIRDSAAGKNKKVKASQI